MQIHDTNDIGNEITRRLIFRCFAAIDMGSRRFSPTVDTGGFHTESVEYLRQISRDGQDRARNLADPGVSHGVRWLERPFKNNGLSYILRIEFDAIAESPTVVEVCMKAITRDELKVMNETEHEDFVLINVLARDAFSKQHIRTSINIPVKDENFVDKVADVVGGKDRKVVVYCASFDCDASSKAAKRLEEAGFTQVYDYEGGTRDWFEKRDAA